jgi:peptide/nickel transport system substrate-binding protein
LIESRPTAALSRRNLLKLGGVAAAASVLSLRPDKSFADSEPEKPKAKRGGAFRVRVSAPPAHFDPHQTAAASTMVPLSFAYSRLVKIKAGVWTVPGTQPIDGDVADSWDRKGDAYIFKLVKGVRWHPKPPVNGRELTAEDVKYTYDRFLNMKGNPNRALLEMVDKVEVLDKLTVKFTLKEPNAWFVERLAAISACIIAKECVEKFGDLKTWQSVVGTGPWMLERSEPTKLNFVRNPNYFQPGAPYVDAVELTVDPDPQSALEAFAAGKYDFGPEYGMMIRRNDLSVAKRAIRWLPTREYLTSFGSAAVMKVDQDPFKDVRVRRAIAMAENWHDVLDNDPLSRGKGVPNPLVPAALKEWSLPMKELPVEGRKIYEPDPAGARQLLTEAGSSGGIKFPAETTPGYGAEWMGAVQIAVKNWKAAGIQAEIKPKEYDAFVSSAIYGKFDKMMLAPRDSANEPDSYFTPLLPGHPLNASGVNDPKLTEMIKLQRRTYDEKKRREIVYDIQRYFSQQAYFTCGASVSAVSAWMPHVRDFSPNIGPDYGGRLELAWIDK